VAAVLQLGSDKKRTTSSRATIFLACWFVGGFLFLSAAQSKLMTYALPLFPPVAVLAGVAFARFFRGTLSPPVKWMVAASFRCACVFGAFGPVVTLWVFDHFLNAPSPAGAYVLAVIAGLVIAAALVIFERGERRTAFALGVLWFPILFVGLMNGPFPQFAELHSQRVLARVISHSAVRPERLVLIGEEAGSLMFYLKPAERAWFREGRLAETDGRTLDRLASLPRGWVVAVTDKELDRTLHAQEVRRLAPSLAGNFRILFSATVNMAEHTTSEPVRRR
jgi:4-amino-4-deoxy-L-arabinose transferase-like glycosyltransferase